LEGLKFSLGTVIGVVGVLASAGISVGVYTSKQGVVETRIADTERSLGDAKNVISELKMTVALMDARIRQVDNARAEDVKKLDDIASKLQGVGDMVLIMCQTMPRPSGVQCKLTR